jgi:hypothetical protein
MKQFFFFLDFPIYSQSVYIHSNTISKWCVGKRGRVEERSVAPLRDKRVKTLSSLSSANVNVIVKCLVLVKINGNNPRKLLNRISENSEMNIKILPLILSPSSVLNSLWNFINSVFYAIVCREGINHILIGINVIPRNVLVHLIDIFIILVDGSNTENKFAIRVKTKEKYKLRLTTKAHKLSYNYINYTINLVGKATRLSCRISKNNYRSVRYQMFVANQIIF